MTKKMVDCGDLMLNGLGNLPFLLLLGTIGSLGESGPRKTAPTRSSADQSLPQHFFTTVIPMLTPNDTDMTENNVRRRRSSSSADTEDSALPLKFLTATHLSALRHLISDEKITVRLGLRVSLTGPGELLDPQLLLSMNKEITPEVKRRVSL
ncbi:uncharacterized protein LOC117559732 isoform X3 [Gymnodraco acuticeps]|uniref:Uncharacterized protein LOC117559732 isoform X3 n=1 Tax=Gymnodraco acuticeps TaxID=8218 RepID=A0A6P8W239_GYMAC|nr:uncharacterized protein LOC117559732 isoform X3 [Gymnodraco acuticeps]